MNDQNQTLSFPLKQFIFLALLVFILIVPGAYQFYEKEVRDIRSEKSEELKTITNFEIKQITRWQNERIADANVISKSVLFTKAFEQLLVKDNNLPLKNLILNRLQTYKEQYKYQNLFISTCDAKLFISSNSDFRTIDSLTAFNIRKSINTKKYLITDIYTFGDNKKIFLDIIAPVMNENHIPIAALIFRFNPYEFLYPIVQSFPLNAKTFESLILRKDGDSILYLSQLRNLKNAALNLRIPLSKKDSPGVRAVLGNLGFNEGPDYRGVQVLYYINKVPGTSWFLESKEDTSEIYSDLHEKAVFKALFVLLLILISGIGIVWIYQFRQRNIYKKLFLAEKKLSRSEEQFTFIIEKSSLGISITSLDGKFLRVNPAFANMLGYSVEEMKKFKFSDITYPDDIEDSLLGLQDVLTGNKSVFEIEKRYIHKNGSIVFADVSVSLQRDVRNDPLYFMTSIINITNRKKAEEEILRLNSTLEQRVNERTALYEESNKELEAFSYSVSHDLRAPLRAIKGFSSIVLEDYSKNLDDEGKRLLNVICQNTKKMELLITDLLDLSRTARSEMRLSLVNMSEMARSIFLEVASLDVINTFNFSVSDLPDAYADTTLMRQVWINIISNAIKYTLPKVKRIIEINGCFKNNMIEYSIKDSGVGFNPAYSNKLFVTFHRLHKADDFEGTGVGLAIVQRIINRHNGEVWAKGEVNEGATFFFSLPGNK